MKDNVTITASIVIYNDNINTLVKSVNSFLQTPLIKKLYLIDNSSSSNLKDQFQHEDIYFVRVPRNIGFGAAHNLILEQISDFSKYHLILNPDVEFDGIIIPELTRALDSYSDVVMIAPKVVFPNGEHQYSCRRYPSFFEMLVRRSIIFRKPFHSVITEGEYRDRDLTKPFHPDFIQGCFQLYKTEDFIQIGGFDERYFLYMEDVDICRKIDGIGKKKLYYPKVQITHVLKKGSSKNLRLFFIHLSSSIKYFKKWGFR